MNPRLFNHEPLKHENAQLEQLIQLIVSGGQTGVDRAALDIAIQFNIPHGGWCPYERKAEDGTISMKYYLKEAPAPTIDESSDPDAIYKKRTELNAKDSDGTLIILKGTPIGGTLFTIEMAKKHHKPYLIIDVSNNPNTAEITDWLIKNNIRILNVAGPRASQTENIYDAAHNLLQQLITQVLSLAPKNKSQINF